MGWIVAPLAVATQQVAQHAAIDPSIPELLYGIAAVIYALAAIRRSTRERISSHSSSTSATSKTQPDTEDTVDVR